MKSNQSKKTSLLTGFLLILFTFCASAAAAESQPSTWPYENETKEQRDARMKWWREARFGMFIHWGVYSVPEGTYKDKKISGIGEWIMNNGKIPVAEYKAYAKEFNPVNYNPDEWVRLAKEAGMKYIVITSKHHDGFALFDSKVTDWDIVDATPYGKDLLKPLAEACKKHGIKLGFYYSQAQDWNHAGGAANGGHWDKAQDGNMNEYIQKIAAPQVREILTNYGNIAVLWWDTPTDMTRQRADMLQPLIKLQPGIITNNRLGGGYPGDTETPEQFIPATGFKNRDWETCMTMNNTWGYKSYDNSWKPPKRLIRNLVDIASKGGNYLLNVGPTSMGEIPKPSVESLREIGKWMKVNSESIYGTTANPFAKLPWGRCTKKEFDNSVILYLHIFEWPEDGTLVVPGLKNKVKQAYLLANRKTETNPISALLSGIFGLFAPQNLKTQNIEEGVKIALPQKPLDEIDTVVVLKVGGKLQVDKVLTKQNKDGTVTLSADTADIHNLNGSDTRLEIKDSISNIGFWTKAGSWVDWSFEIDKPGRFEVYGYIALEPQTSSFEIISGDQKFTATAASTSGYDKFVKTKLGEIKLNRAGEHRLEIKPLAKQWQPINLRTIVLTPIE